MAKLAKLFWNGRSQAVRLPQEFRFEGDQVRIRRQGVLVILEPLSKDPKAWLERLARYDSEAFMPEGRKQPKAPKRQYFR